MVLAVGSKYYKKLKTKEDWMDSVQTVLGEPAIQGSEIWNRLVTPQLPKFSI